jgi:type IV pilus assembly protein PilW
MKNNHFLFRTDKTEIFNCKNQFKGFTLIELMIAMAVGLVLIAAVYSVFILQNKELNKQEQIAVMQDNARMAMDMMSKEIMLAGYGPSIFARCAGTTTATNTPCLGITAANANAISFTLDLNGDGVHTDANENITYDLYTSGGVQVLGRKSSATANRQPVVEYVSALVFSYLPATGTTPTTNLASIRRIQISVTTKTANIDLNTGNYLYYNLVSIVTPRNLQLPGF